MSVFALAVALMLPAAAQEAGTAPQSAEPTAAAEGWDFVPGEKLLLYDDFTDMVKGGQPPHWKVRGSSAKLGGNGRLLIDEDASLFPNVVSWPKNFTIESEFTFEKGAEETERHLTWSFDQEQGDYQWRFWMNYRDEDGFCEIHLEGEESLGDAACKVQLGQPATMNLWLQDGRIRIYVNGARVVDVNQVQLQPWKIAYLYVETGGAPVSFGRFRIAESAPDVSQTILATGRYVSHGIQFDVNSDRLKPESASVLKEIAGALQKQGTLKLRIEGHTDSTGDAAKNLDLSKRRAAAVKNALVAQFGIASERLTSEGFGASKPVAPNETVEGRANNRRVEFVKL